MGDGKNENIGSFPKVLELADYQSDVYAILNEYGYQRTSEEIDNPREFFKETIETAIETMWSFDDLGYPLIQIQVRRLNRYLIWHWQLIRIEKSKGSLDEIVKILEERPHIELSGLKTKEENGRFYFELEQNQNFPLELAIFYKNSVIRRGSTSHFKIEDIIDGIENMKSDKILAELRRFLPKES